MATSIVKSVRATNSEGTCCPACGHANVNEREPVLKRGAVIVAFDPVVVTWHGRPVPLSPTEGLLYAYICRRGRVTYEELDAELDRIGATAATRSLVLGHITSKFVRLGACAPFERLGMHGLRLQVDADEGGRTLPVIGLQLPRYATIRRDPLDGPRRSV